MLHKVTNLVVFWIFLFALQSSMAEAGAKAECQPIEVKKVKVKKVVEEAPVEAVKAEKEVKKVVEEKEEDK
mgnify:CR=1 FL=1